MRPRPPSTSASPATAWWSWARRWSSDVAGAAPGRGGQAIITAMDTPRVTATGATREDELAELSIRPKKLDEYLGQEAVREQLTIFIEAAKARSEALDHVLIFGPPG